MTPGLAAGLGGIALVLAAIGLLALKRKGTQGFMPPMQTGGSGLSGVAVPNQAGGFTAQVPQVVRMPFDLALAMFTESATQAGSLQHVAWAATGPLIEALGIQQVLLLQKEKDGYSAMIPETGELQSSPPSDVEKAISVLNQHPDPVIFEALGRQSLGETGPIIAKLGHYYGASAMLALIHKAQLLGVLVLVDRPNRAFDNAEYQFLAELQLRAAASAANATFLSEIATRAKLESEVNVALEVQRELLPKKSELEIAGVQLAGHYRSGSTGQGSNFWTYQSLPDGRLLLMLGHVAGDGLAASMTAAVTLGALDVLLKLEEVADAGRLMAQLNLALYLPDVKPWVTTGAALFQPKTGRVTFANAGSPFPYVLSPGTGKLDIMVARGAAVGDRPFGRFDAAERQYKAGDTFVFHTRGFVEHTDSSGQMYGDWRLQQALRSGGERGLDARSLRDKILLDVQSFAKGAAGTEDEVLVVVRTV